MKTAGRILIIPRGTYDAKTTYEILDLVSYNGTSWLAKKTAIGIEPNNTNNEYWHKMFDFVIVNNLDEETEGCALDARQGTVLKRMVEEKEVYETVSVTTDEKGKVSLPIKEGYGIYSAFSNTAGYIVVGSIDDMYLRSFDKGIVGDAATNILCEIAVIYVKKGVDAYA